MKNPRSGDRRLRWDLLSGGASVLVGATLLGATLGYIGFAGLHFWQNREMSQCASAGLLGDEAAGVERASRDDLQGGSLAGALGGAGLGLLVGLAAHGLSVRRLGRALRAAEEDEGLEPSSPRSRSRHGASGRPGPRLY